MRTTAFLLLLIWSLQATSQKQNYDILNYTIPQGWKKTVTEAYSTYTTTNTRDKSWCRITVIKSSKSLGSLEKDFTDDWQSLIATQYNITDKPQKDSSYDRKGWHYRTGSGKFTFNNADAFVKLVTISGFGVRTAVISLTSSTGYNKDITAVFTSVDPQQSLVKTTVQSPTTVVQPEKTVPVSAGFTFTITNFDDGWVSVAREDWVEVTRRNVKVLLHYPRKGTRISADPAPYINNAWNILVAPRYKDLKNYVSGKTIIEQYRGYTAGGDVTEIITGKQVYVVLFEKENSGFIEVITPDMNTFIREFGFNINDIKWDWDSRIWEPLMKLKTYNRFAVAVSDLKGTWTNDFNGALDMYNIFTGQYAGMNTSQSSSAFQFGAGNTYSWKLLAINGMTGAMKYDQVKSSGKFSMTGNWQIDFTKIEDRPRSFDAYFTCIKGARILWLHDKSYSDGIYTPYGQAK